MTQATQEQLRSWMREDERKSADQLYDEIVTDIRKTMSNDASDPEVHGAARNVIGLFQAMIGK